MNSLKIMSIHMDYLNVSVCLAGCDLQGQGHIAKPFQLV